MRNHYAPLRPAATALVIATIAILALTPPAIAIRNVSVSASQARSATQAAYREASAQTARREASEAAIRTLLVAARAERDIARAEAAAVSADNASLRARFRKPQSVVQVASSKRQVKVKRTTPVRTTKARGGMWVITAYCSCRRCCGKSNGITASGRKASAGTVAAPRSLPFGTRLRIGNLGTFTVRDRGGSIRGHRIDMWVSSHAAALRFGRRTLRVEVL